MDRTTGEFVLHLRATAVSMEQSYQRVRDEREAARVACIPVYTCPAAKAALTVALTIEAGTQTAFKAYWESERAQWETSRLSHLTSLDLWSYGNFPMFPYPIVDPALGLVGTEEVQVSEEMMPDLNLHISSRNLNSTASASRTSMTNWKVAWTE